ncbi:AAA family ATPase [Aliarcobacter butzleri]|uniref:AAA family ATPase n=1 Tax=Aliarcobacter butzleri TaxID=28197 RepID=UPI00345025AE
MELVYLWVEEYKNIHKQGFNFSPRFRCEFKAEYEKYIDTDGKEKEKLKDNCELIIEKKEYKSIFPDNINITAIVAENGSGKSSLFELLEERLLNYKINILFFNNKEKKFYYKYLNIKQINTKYEIESMEGKDYYDLDFPVDINILNSKADGKTDTENDVDSKLSELFENEHDCFDFLDSKLIFKFWNIKFSNILNSLNTNIKKLDERYEFSNSFISKHEKNKEEIYLEIFVFVAIKLILYIIIEPLEKSKYSELLKELSENFTKKNYLNLVNSITLERLNDSEKYNLILETLQKFDESILKIEKLINSKQKINSIEINKFMKSGLYETFHNFYNDNFKSGIIKIDFITENDLHFLDLSSGEQQRIIYCLFLAHDLILREGDKHLLIKCYDEPDVYIHPNWQRLIVSDFLNLIKKYLINIDETIHLIITSHSPFILSDLPKENVIFLEKGKQVYPFEDGKQTFGANIHTLLSHGFFMKDGLMGEFAKDKIDTAIKYLNQKVLTNDELDYCENIISIIGEPIIKRELQRKLDSKRLSKIDKIEEIEEQMKLLQNRLEMIRKNQK